MKYIKDFNSLIANQLVEVIGRYLIKSQKYR